MDIFDLLPVQYRTYLESMLPWKQNAPLTKDDLSPAIIKSMTSDALNAFENTGELSGRIEGTPDKDLWETLGKYDYNINRPSAPNFESSINFEDVYSWKPEYNELGQRVGYNNPGVGSDVNLPMLFRGVGHWLKGDTGFRNVAEMVGNYIGPTETRGEGRPLNINVPIDNSRIRKRDNIRRFGKARIGRQDAQAMRGV